MRKFQKKLLACFLSAALCAGSFGSMGNVQTVSADTDGTVEAEVVVEDVPPADDMIMPEAVPLTDADEIILEKVPVYDAGTTSPDFSKLNAVIKGGFGSYGKSKLSAAQQGFYDALESVCIDFLTANKDVTQASPYTSGVSYGSAGLSFAQAQQAYIAFYYDHPSYFWLGGYGYSKGSPVLYVSVRKSYLTDKLRDALETKIINGVKAYKTVADKYSDVWDKVCAIHDKMILDVEYAYKSNGSTPESADWAHTVEGVFDSSIHRVVCEGYAKSFSLITNYLNIPSIFIVGTAGGAHAWNAVSFDGGTTYSYMDLTWDDAKGTQISYEWFAMPSSNFTKRHRAYGTGGSGWNWLYKLPVMTSNMSYTYFMKKNAYATAALVKDDASALTFLSTAGLSSPSDTMVILADTPALIGTLMRAYQGVGGYSYYISSAYGKYYQYFDATRYKVKNPAKSFTLSASSTAPDKAKKSTVTLTIGSASGSDDRILLSLSNQAPLTLSSTILNLANKETKVTLNLRRIGTTTITAKSLIGGRTQTCQVTVTDSSVSSHIYLDENHTQAAGTSTVIYANGGVKTETSGKVNYKTKVLYTDLVPPTYLNANKKNVTGSIVVGLTTGKTEPTFVNNKVTSDAEAVKIASAAYKKLSATNGSLTITAKNPGTVYVWLFAATAPGTEPEVVGYVPVTVKAAPTKVIFQDTECVDGAETATFSPVVAKTVSLNTSFDIYLNPTIVGTGKNVRKTGTDSTFSLNVPEAVKPYLSVTPITGKRYGFRVTPTALNNGKVTKAVLSAVCGQNATNAKLTVTITNSVKKMSFAKLDATDTSFTVTGGNTSNVKVAIAKGAGVATRTVKLKETTEWYNTSANQLDGVKIYQLPTADGFTINNAGAVTVAKGITAEQKKVSMALVKKTKDEYQITAKPAITDGVTAYLLVVHNGLAGQGTGWQVVEVTVGKSGTRGNENILWAGASDIELKKTKLNTTLEPGTYVSGKKTLAGKIVWISRTSKSTPRIDTTTRTVDLKSENTVASVTSGGIVTALAGGTAYIYACATSTGKYEEFVVNVKATPANVRLYQSASANPVNGDVEYKTATVAQGSSVEIYVKGTIGAKTKTSNTIQVLSGDGYDYTWSVAEKLKNYVEVVQKGEHFTIKVKANAWTLSGTKPGKKLSIPLNFICIKNGKKAVFTLSVTQ